VPHAHDGAVLSPGGDLQVIGALRLVNHKAVVPPCLKRAVIQVCAEFGCTHVMCEFRMYEDFVHARPCMHEFLSSHACVHTRTKRRGCAHMPRWA
jgi:hypothetical protein